ncbi:MAG: aldo/keto reductase, partial [Clostridiales bacterium]|nr:aldo/keto reductase [Clostridiales bacterium]
DFINAWKSLENAVYEGKIKSIGISNFNREQTEKILENCRIKPVVNQIECHPYFQQHELRSFFRKNNIATEVWYPLGHGDKNLLSEQIFQELSHKYEKTVAQIILKWHVQLGNIILPKSLNPIHMEENLDIYDFVMSDEELTRINLLDKNKSYYQTPEWLDRVLYRFLKD